MLSKPSYAWTTPHIEIANKRALEKFGFVGRGLQGTCWGCCDEAENEGRSIKLD